MYADWNFDIILMLVVAADFVAKDALVNLLLFTCINRSCILTEIWDLKKEWRQYRLTDHLTYDLLVIQFCSFVQYIELLRKNQIRYVLRTSRVLLKSSIQENLYWI